MKQYLRLPPRNVLDHGAVVAGVPVHEDPDKLSLSTKYFPDALHFTL